MGKLILVRHGESTANRLRFFADEHTPLTDLGRRQAQEVGALIAARFRPTAIVSSHLLRAQQTAEIVSQHVGLPVEVIDGLHECDFGILKGQPYPVFHDMIRSDATYDAKRPWTWVPEAGESTEQTALRVIAVLERLRSQYPSEEILVVCHGMVMMAVTAHLKGAWEGADVPPNCAVLVIGHDEERLHAPVLVEECLVAQE